MGVKCDDAEYYIQNAYRKLHWNKTLVWLSPHSVQKAAKCEFSLQMYILLLLLTRKRHFAVYIYHFSHGEWIVCAKACLGVDTDRRSFANLAALVYFNNFVYFAELVVNIQAWFMWWIFYLVLIGIILHLLPILMRGY